MANNYEMKFKKCEKDLLKANHDLDLLYEKYDNKTSELKQRIRDLENNNTRNNTNENLSSWVERFETLHNQYEDIRERYNQLADKYNKDMEDRRIERNQTVEQLTNEKNQLIEQYNNLIVYINKNTEWIEMAKKELTKCGYVISNPPPTPIAKPAATTIPSAKPSANQKCEGSDCTIMGGKKYKKRTNRYRKRNKISRKQQK
jgi:hypothetical protein